jgi:hypothetical protein
MALHLVKLCVGVSAVEELQAWVDRRQAERRLKGLAAETIHTTRMTPRRMDELLEGGSLFWVIRGNIQVRQRLLAIRPFTDGNGIRRCDIVMEPRLVATQWQPRRAFQGWRYLKDEEVPGDTDGPGGLESLPGHLRVELADLGLL